MSMNTCPECALGNHDACTSDLAPCDCAGSGHREVAA